MNKRYSGLLASICICLCFLISGCADGQFGFTFNEDGTITQRNSLQFQQGFKDLGNYFGQSNEDFILEQKQEDSQNGFSIEDVQNGYTATKTITLKDLAGLKIFQPGENTAGVQVKKGFLYDYYSIDSYLKGQYQSLPQSNYAANIPSYFSPNMPVNIWDYMEYRKQAEAEARQLDEISNQMIKAAISSMNLNLVINLPYEVDSSNADNLTNGNKTLTWNLKPAVFDGKDLSVQAKFKIYHEKTIIGLIIVGSILLIVAIILLVLGFVKKNSNKQSVFFIVAGIIIVFLGCFGVYVNYNIKHPPVLTDADKLVVVAEKSMQKSEEPEAKQQKNAQSEDVLTKANNVLQNKNSEYKLSAVSKIDEDGFFGIDTRKGVIFVIYDKKDDIVASVGYDKKILNPKANKYKTSDKDYMPLIFKMYIKNDDKNGGDKDLGTWTNETHIIPIYALYDVDSNNNIVPGMLNSAQGSNPSHYHDVLKEQKNVNLANIVLTHAESLNEDINKRGVSLP